MEGWTVLAVAALATVVAATTAVRRRQSRTKQLLWPKRLTSKQLLARATVFFANYSLSVKVGDGFIDLIVSTRGLAFGVIARPCLLLITDERDTLRERIAREMPMLVLTNFEVNPAIARGFRERSVLLMHYRELRDFVGIFAETPIDEKSPFYGFVRCDQKLSLYLAEKFADCSALETAINWAKHAVSINPRRAELSYRVLLRLQGQSHLFREAAQTAIVAAKQFPMSEYFVPTISDMYMRAGDLEAALDWTEEGLRFGFDRERLFVRLAVLHSRLGNVEQAEEALAAASAAAPESPEIAEAAKQVELLKTGATR